MSEQRLPFDPPVAFEYRLLHPRYFGVWIAIGLLWLLSWLPIGLRHALGRMIGRFAWRINKKRRRVVLVNLRLCFPGWNEQKRVNTGIAHFEAMAGMMLDYGLVWFGSETRLKRFALVDGWEHVECARAKGRQVIYHVAHAVGLEFGALAIGAREPAVGMYQPFKNPLINWIVARSRRKYGNELITRRTGLRAVLRCLKAGKAAYTLSDEDLGLEGAAVVPFFSHPKATLLTTARMGPLANADIIPMFSYYDAGRQAYVTRLLPAIEGIAGTSETAEHDARLLNASIETVMDVAPAQYMWAMKLFRSTGARDAYRTAPI